MPGHRAENKTMECLALNGTFKSHTPFFGLRDHCGRWGGRSVRAKGVDNKGIVFLTQLESRIYEAIAVMTAYTRLIQDQ